MMLAYPLGYYVRNRPIKPLLYASGIFFPLMSFGLVMAVEAQMEFWLYPLFMAWGASFFAVQAVAVPYMLRNCPEEQHSEALALNFTAWSLAVVSAGGISYALSLFAPGAVSEKTVLQGFALMGLISLYFITRIRRDDYEALPNPQAAGDWGLIARALMPTVVIAVGAGLTIQFMNLFFYTVFGVDYELFSLMGAMTAIVASIAVLMVPRVKTHFGFRKAIPATQGMAVLALIGLGCTEYFSHVPGVLSIAIILYVIRQPLMNMANPMTSELVMAFVGPKNREMTAALNGAVWSGSWFMSSMMFAFLRKNGADYAQIFFLTAILYSIGVYLFYLLIKMYEVRKAAADV